MVVDVSERNIFTISQ